MMEFAKLCREYEKLSAAQRGVILAKSSVSVLAKLKLLNLPGVDPVHTLAGFILGSVVVDGRVNEQEYLLIYPALLHLFGDDFDFDSVKKSFRLDGEGRSAVKKYTEELLALLSLADESLREDLITLCLCAVTVDGKISLRERNYIRRLATA